MMDVITFGDLSKENVRLTPPLVNGERCLSIRDFIMVMCDKTRVRANDVWSSLSEDRKAELAAYVGFYHFKGKVIAFPDHIQILGDRFSRSHTNTR